MIMEELLALKVNGVKYTFSWRDIGDESLCDVLRNSLGLVGTKAMCREGGCGACSVVVVRPDRARSGVVNSCLVPALSCDGWEVKTVEGITDGSEPHVVQGRLATNNGTQCGYCTPGWVMTMYSLYENQRDSLKMEQIEDSFAGNMCRCTGYRPILHAFRTFASDAPPSLSKLQDLEDLAEMKCVKKQTERENEMSGWCILDKPKTKSLKKIELATSTWYSARTIKDVFQLFKTKTNYRLVAGNTGSGVYPIKEEPSVWIDISSVDELTSVSRDMNLVIGAGLTLTEFMDELVRYSKADADFGYLQVLRDHLDLVAHLAVRNLGTVGGNLALKNHHHDFPSDIFLLLLTVQATVTIVDANNRKNEVTMQEFLNSDLKNKLILNVKLPPLSNCCVIKTYKIMPREQNAHAIVNSGFLFELDQGEVKRATIAYGAINPTFTRAGITEAALIGRKLFTNETLQIALNKLNEELIVEDNPPEASAYCRKSIALGLFYKAILSLSPSTNPRYKSGGTLLKRELSNGTQTYDTDSSWWPINQPVMKLEALAQCMGTAEYACDKSANRTVHAAFVLSTVCTGNIVSFDAEEALKIPGVLAFYTAKDIPGNNSFIPKNFPWLSASEEILASNVVSYYGQPVAIIVATSFKLAWRASEMVKVKYSDTSAKPVLDIKSALSAVDKDRRVQMAALKPSINRGTDIVHKITGSFVVGTQYHYTMETQSCYAEPTPRGLKVRSATQWPDLVHVAISSALGIDQNKIEIEVGSVGGGYGGKASRSSLTACACAFTAHTLRRPVSLVMALTANMAAIGKRQACSTEYTIEVNAEGVIQNAELNIYSDTGFVIGDSSAATIPPCLGLLYDTARWKITAYNVITDKAANTWCRAPGTNEAASIGEHIMEKIAFTTNRDPWEVRMANFSSTHDGIKDMIAQFKVDSKYEELKEEIKGYNEANAWKKRGLGVSVMSFPISYVLNYPVTLSVYHGDGTVCVSHGGIEMGQGINTKVAQVCAHTLQIPLNAIAVKEMTSFISPNAMVSSGSITSESVAYATVKACQDLLTRLDPLKNVLVDKSWLNVVKTAYNAGLNLQSSYMMSPSDGILPYSVSGVCITEAEIDVLTGRHRIRSVKLIEDTGRSLSQLIDVGQIEGAYIMGVGLWTSENLVHDPETGRLLTDRTWNYKPPGARDIPENFEVTFKRNSVNPAGVLGSKATGEPAFTLAVGLTFALNNAIAAARKEFGHESAWIDIDGPYTVDNIITAISPNYEYFKIE